jgi:hypothetical protein
MNNLWSLSQTVIIADIEGLINARTRRDYGCVGPKRIKREKEKRRKKKKKDVRLAYIM